MGIDLDRGDRRSLAIAGGVFLLLVGVAMILAPSTDTARDVPTTYSTASGGAKAAWLLLRESGYRVQRWERPPVDLPAPAGTVLILADPGALPADRDRKALNDFVTNGGRVIATSVQSAMFFQATGMRNEPITTNTWEQVPAVALSPITRAAPRITLGPWAHFSASAPGVPLYADDRDTRVLARQIGKGEIVFWASATPLTNAGLKEPGNVEFFLACVGPSDKVAVLWDEYFHGHRQSLAASAMRTPLAWLAVHLAIAALAVVLTWSRRSAPVFVPASDTRLSPLEFVRTLGHLYEHAGAAGVAVDVGYSRFRYWLTRRLGQPADASPEVLEGALRERWRFEDKDFLATLTACEAAREQPDLRPREALRLMRALHRYSVALKLYRA